MLVKCYTNLSEKLLFTMSTVSLLKRKVSRGTCSVRSELFTRKRLDVVEGLNVINAPKCNIILNVITFGPQCNNIWSSM